MGRAVIMVELPFLICESSILIVGIAKTVPKAHIQAPRDQRHKFRNALLPHEQELDIQTSRISYQFLHMVRFTP
jgi:hypothetical protein